MNRFCSCVGKGNVVHSQIKCVAEALTAVCVGLCAVVALLLRRIIYRCLFVGVQEFEHLWKIAHLVVHMSDTVRALLQTPRKDCTILDGFCLDLRPGQPKFNADNDNDTQRHDTLKRRSPTPVRNLALRT